MDVSAFSEVLEFLLPQERAAAAQSTAVSNLAVVLLIAGIFKKVRQMYKIMAYGQ